MRRRGFLGLIGAAVAWPLTTLAQQVGKIYRIGILEAIPLERNAANLDALRKGCGISAISKGRTSFSNTGLRTVALSDFPTSHPN